MAVSSLRSRSEDEEEAVSRDTGEDISLGEEMLAGVREDGAPNAVTL